MKSNSLHYHELQTVDVLYFFFKFDRKSFGIII